MRILEANRKVDICFFNSYSKLISFNHLGKYFFSLRLVASFIFGLIHIVSVSQQSNQSYQLVSIFFLLAMISNSLCLIQCLIFYRKILKNIEFIYQIADMSLHLQTKGDEDQIADFQVRQGLNVCKTTFQFQSATSLQQTNQQLRKVMQNGCKNLIQNHIDQKMCWLKIFRKILSLISIAMFIFGCIVSSMQGLTFYQYHFLQLYLITQFLSQMLTFIVFFLICLIPIFILLFCIYACFCNKSRENFKLPESSLATIQIINDCSGQCSICFQNICQNQQVISLKCSPHHVFHKICIQSWTKVKTNCPNCRQPINI